MGSQLPTAGTAIEVQGVMGSFVGVDLKSDGGVAFTVKAARSNVRQMLEHLQASGQDCVQISDEIIQVPYSACRWRSMPAGGLFDAEAQVMLGQTEGCQQVSKIALQFQTTLSRRNRL